jgi:hypothetical protein
LARLTAAAARVDSATDLDRSALRAWVSVCAVVRDGLTRSGIDPARARALRLGEAAAAQLAESGGITDLRRADEELATSDHDGLAGTFAAKIGDLARGFQDGRDPDFSNASLAELFAWCLARPHPDPPPPAGEGMGGAAGRLA